MHGFIMRTRVKWTMGDGAQTKKPFAHPTGLHRFRILVPKLQLGNQKNLTVPNQHD